MIRIVLPLIKETDVRKINFFIFIFVLVIAPCLSCVSCMTEVKPVLKPRVVPIAQRIADQEMWLDQDVADKAINPGQAKPIRDKLGEIKKQYDRRQSAGTLTRGDSEDLNRMLDKTSDQIFRISTKGSGFHSH